MLAAVFLLCMDWILRLLGLGFAVPGTYFLARGFINGALGRRLGVLFLMGVAQGLVGWWMVRSGLKVGALVL
jgi:cytochrome c oxidase assembly protein subunit 15